MTKTLKLKNVATNTEFTYADVLWKKGSWGNVHEVDCTPKYGGQWQDSLKQSLKLDIDVTIKADRF